MIQMAKGAKDLKFGRRREALTNYPKRIALLKSGLERVVVRKTNSKIIGQVIAYDEKGDKVRASVDSKELVKLGWPSRCNKPTAYLAGLLLAKKADKNKEYILDIGLSVPVKGSIPFVFAKGCVEGGMKVRGNFDMEEEVYNGSLISKYAEALKNDKEKYMRQFGGYISKGIQPENLPNLFAQIKEKIIKA